MTNRKAYAEVQVRLFGRVGGAYEASTWPNTKSIEIIKLCWVESKRNFKMRATIIVEGRRKVRARNEASARC